jgi:hypothetical protein
MDGPSRPSSPGLSYRFVSCCLLRLCGVGRWKWRAAWRHTLRHVEICTSGGQYTSRSGGIRCFRRLLRDSAVNAVDLLMAILGDYLSQGTNNKNTRSEIVCTGRNGYYCAWTVIVRGGGVRQHQQLYPKLSLPRPGDSSGECARRRVHEPELHRQPIELPRDAHHLLATIITEHIAQRLPRQLRHAT